MTLKPIRNDQDYQAALQEIELLWDAEPDSPESDMLEIWVTLVEAYEKNRFDLPAPDPIAALEYFMESRGWTRKQLEPYIGSRGRVSEILSRKRPLTLAMIRRLEQATGIPGSILIQPYQTDQDDLEAQARKTPIDRSSRQLVASAHHAR
jgi:HTH-type transcriptional regulator/antitoxin HigA